MGDKKKILAVSVEEAARKLGLGRAAAYAAVKRGEIPCKRVGRRIVIPIEVLERWLDETDAKPKSAA